jgi:hypothetical protein
MTPVLLQTRKSEGSFAEFSSSYSWVQRYEVMYAPLFDIRTGILLTSTSESTANEGTDDLCGSERYSVLTVSNQTSEFRSNIKFTSVEETRKTHY